MPNSSPENAGATSHVRDCQMWAEIDYLDSPTDYRECLPGQETQPVMLDGPSYNSTRGAGKVSLVAMGVITMIIFLLICGCFFHLFFDAF